MENKNEWMNELEYLTIFRMRSIYGEIQFRSVANHYSCCYLRTNECAVYLYIFSLKKSEIGMSDEFEKFILNFSISQSSQARWHRAQSSGRWS